jgi:hypothetical protein
MSLEKRLVFVVVNYVNLAKNEFNLEKFDLWRKGDFN